MDVSATGPTASDYSVDRLFLSAISTDQYTCYIRLNLNTCTKQQSDKNISHAVMYLM